MEAEGDEVSKALVHARLDAKRVEVVTRECAAFYCILLGHQDRVAVAKVEIAGSERVMVGEGMGREREAERRQRGEEPRRVTSCDRVQTLPRSAGFRSSVGIARRGP
jgi:hypothetical protein